MAPKNQGPESGAAALCFQQHQQLVNENLCLGLESRGLCREHFKFPWPKFCLWMKTCELKFPLGSCWILWKKCSWMKTRDPSLSLTLMLKIQLWIKPWAWRLAKLFKNNIYIYIKTKKKLIGWCFSTKKWNPLLNVFRILAKAICGLKPNAPALGF